MPIAFAVVAQASNAVIAIVDQITAEFVSREGFSELLAHPCGGTRGRVAPTQTTGGRWHGEEARGRDLLNVTREARAPGLRWWRGRRGKYFAIAARDTSSPNFRSSP